MKVQPMLWREGNLFLERENFERMILTLNTMTYQQRFARRLIFLHSQLL